ncbi:unnamed protein product [Urochloa humidicola]
MRIQVQEASPTSTIPKLAGQCTPLPSALRKAALAAGRPRGAALTAGRRAVRSPPATPPPGGPCARRWSPLRGAARTAVYQAVRTPPPLREAEGAAGRRAVRTAGCPFAGPRDPPRSQPVRTLRRPPPGAPRFLQREKEEMRTR